MVRTPSGACRLEGSTNWASVSECIIPGNSNDEPSHGLWFLSLKVFDTCTQVQRWTVRSGSITDPKSGGTIYSWALRAYIQRNVALPCWPDRDYSLSVLWPAIPMKFQRKRRTTPRYSTWLLWDQCDQSAHVYTRAPMTCDHFGIFKIRKWFDTTRFLLNLAYTDYSYRCVHSMQVELVSQFGWSE